MRNVSCYRFIDTISPPDGIKIAQRGAIPYYARRSRTDITRVLALSAHIYLLLRRLSGEQEKSMMRFVNAPQHLVIYLRSVFCPLGAA